jgi:hypothetical protein
LIERDTGRVMGDVDGVVGGQQRGDRAMSVDWVAGSVRNGILAGKARAAGNHRAAALHSALARGFLEGVAREVAGEQPLAPIRQGMETHGETEGGS